MKFALVNVVVGVVLGVASVVAAQRPTAPIMEVYKSPTCGCCSIWVDHVRKAGFTTRVSDIDDASLDALKAKHGVPRTAQSCHTALVGGYVIEGHAPAAEIHRLLREKPAVRGIAVGGMPVGSPGMEVPGQRPQTYNVVTFDQKGNVKVFSTQNQ
jgi:hypothetical protein